MATGAGPLMDPLPPVEAPTLRGVGVADTARRGVGCTWKPALLAPDADGGPFGPAGVVEEALAAPPLAGPRGVATAFAKSKTEGRRSGAGMERCDGARASGAAVAAAAVAAAAAAAVAVGFAAGGLADGRASSDAESLKPPPPSYVAAGAEEADDGAGPLSALAVMTRGVCDPMLPGALAGVKLWPTLAPPTDRPPAVRGVCRGVDERAGAGVGAAFGLAERGVAAADGRVPRGVVIGGALLRGVGAADGRVPRGVVRPPPTDPESPAPAEMLRAVGTWCTAGPATGAGAAAAAEDARRCARAAGDSLMTGFLYIL